MTGQKAGLASQQSVQRAIRLMTTLNRAARDEMVRFRVHACTDVTGFSLMGHALEMAQGSGVTLLIDAGAIDLIPEAVELARMGILPEGMYRNRSFAEPHITSQNVPLEVMDVLFDPQTSGGLLIAVDPEDADALMDALNGKVPSAQRIGQATEKRDVWIEVKP
jgi:selenide, water dikinase